MGLFEQVNIQDMESRMHLLEQEKAQDASASVQLDDKQIQFLKRYFKFQSFFLKKVQKDNRLNEGYLIIVPNKGSGNDDVYIVITKSVLYLVRHSVSTLRFRLVKDRLRIEVATFPSPAFLPCDISTYRTFFNQLFVLFRRVFDFPSQFIVSTKEGLSVKQVNDSISFGQLVKYL